jgi:hypothetical protein
MKENPFIYVVERAKRTLFLPIYKYVYTLKQKTNLKLLLTKVLLRISSGLRGLFVLRPQKATDYFYAGRLGIYKKLVILLVLLICLAPVIYFQFFSTTVSNQSTEVARVYEYVYNDPDLEAFSGTTRILSAGKKLVYEGAVEKGLCTGKGKLYDFDGLLLYSGDFVNNEYSGSGELYDTHGSLLYSGGFANNEYNGNGKLYYPSGKTRYEGMFEAGLYNGAGVLYNESGSVLYTGAFVDNVFSGEGTLYDAATSRMVYSGSFVNGLYEGKGTLYSSIGRSKFTGQFLKGLPDYVYFLSLPTSELGNYFPDSPVVAYSGNTSASLTYSEMKIALLSNEAETEELTESTVSSVMVYDNTMPAGLADSKASSGLESLLGVPIYEGCSYPLSEDLIALESLSKQGVLTEADTLYTETSEEDASISTAADEDASFSETADEDASISTAADEDASISETADEDVSISTAADEDLQLYLACYEYQGFALTLFFDKKGGKFLYYRWDI